MSGCEGCFQSMRGMQEAMDRIKVKAKQYAVEIGASVAIYQDGYEYRYMDADKAIEQKLQIKDIIPK